MINKVVKVTQRSRKPEGLTGRAAELWDAVTSTYALRADELVILEDAAREVALIDRLETALVGAPLTVRGSVGQDAANPMITEIRQHRGLLASLFKALKLPDQPAQPKLSPSEAARKAAHARWGNSGKDGA